MNKLIVLLLLSTLVGSSYQSKDPWDGFSNLKEVQLTHDPSGHYLHSTQYFSPDNQWIVYDKRNDGTQIGQTGCIEAVNVKSKEVKQLYKTRNQTEFGPGVGGATFSPTSDIVLFIHGLQNCNSSNPYNFSRRTGVAVSTDNPGNPIFMDARDVEEPFTPGALRGGTHAHTWSADGLWISFTYNDAIMAHLKDEGMESAGDLRMVGVMGPYGPVNVDENSNDENFSGIKCSTIVTRVHENPEPGSNQIDRAYSDGWVGLNGYVKEDGNQQLRAVAFLGDTRNTKGEKLTEVFLVDIPEDITSEVAGHKLTGTLATRPAPPKNANQRRLTFTEVRKYPGVQGPRHWLRTTPDGSWIFFLMKDQHGIVQVYGISPNGGPTKKFTSNNFSVETTFNVSPDGQFLAYGSNQTVYVTHIETGQTKQVSPTPDNSMNHLKSIHWSKDGKMLAYNRKVAQEDSSYFQVFLLAK